MNKVIFDTDAYKNSQFAQYQPNTENLYSYFESRLGGKSPFDKTIFFGLQYLLKTVLSNPITKEDVDKAEVLFTKTMGIFNRKGWDYIVDNHNGYMPVEIRAIPEGTPIKRGNALYTIESTDSNCFWVTQWLETLMVRLWYTTNIATICYYTKLKLIEYAKITSDLNPLESINYKMCNFGARGSSSEESSAIGGMAHLVLFAGTDNMTSLLTIQNVYDTDIVYGASVVSSEHSCHTSWGELNELKSYENIIDTFGGNVPVYGMVIDSYDMEYAIKNIIGIQLKEKIQKTGTTFVVRLDSGIPTESVLNALKWLEDSYSTTLNSKGYKVLPNYIRILQGDGISYDTICEICQVIENNGYSIDNIIFGQGGALMQGHNRDTLQFAQKCSNTIVNGIEIGVQKMPKSDMTKTSKKGKFSVVKLENEHVTVSQTECKENNLVDCFETVYFKSISENKPILTLHSFDEVRKNTGLW